MQEEEAPKGCTKNEVVHARLSQGLKQSLDLYAEAHGLTLSSAVATLLEQALEDGSEMDDIKATVSEILEALGSVEEGLCARIETRGEGIPSKPRHASAHRVARARRDALPSQRSAP